VYFFRYCPDCGGQLPALETPGDHLASQRCLACGAVHFRNAKPCAGALVVHAGRVLLGRRAIDPGQGLWDIPGGFLEPWEHPADGAVREIAEETGLRVRVTSLLTVVMDTYYEQFYTMNVYYLAEIVGGQAQAADDLAELGWFKPDEIPPDLAFAHCRQVLAAWSRHEEAAPSAS
jgi:ADP-ribose pyrophosphatase YjhB (NUDIX family)